ncbi:MAG: DMT family transporter [Thermoanaerobaculia bacterium]|nr:DMT family transporter [Thermoanaerobaculia bacterium]
MTPATRAQLQIHACVLLWGATAILGKAISLPALPLVFWRMVIVAGTLALLPAVRREWRGMKPSLRLTYAGIGSVLALHWLTFYGSIKLSNASVGATCIALGPVFLAFVEPALVGRRFNPREILLAAAVVPGVGLVAGGVPPGMLAGVATGTVSAFLVAVFSALNKRFVERGRAIAITGLEIGAGALLVTLLAPLLPHEGPAFPLPGARDALLLVFLAYACTLVPFTLSLVALRQLSAFATSLAVNLEAVYATVFAAILLGEHRQLSPRFYLGAGVIVLGVLLHPLIVRRQSQP